MRIAYIASRYPHISHTFIRREVTALRAEGVEVDTFTIRRSEADAHYSPEDVEAAATTTAIVPVAVPMLAWIQLGALRRDPGAYWRTLMRTVREAPPGLRRRVWAAFYFVEGIVLWWHCDRRGIRHVHAHFANVGADVARVAARFGRAADPDGRWSWSFTMHGYTEFSDVSAFDLGGKADDADAIVCISDYARTQMILVSQGGAWGRMHIVHCGVDVERFTPAPPAAPGGPLRVLSLGRLVVEKGPIILVEAVALLRDRGIDVELTLVGGGPAQAEIEDTVRCLGLEEHVALPGPVQPDEAPTKYHAADVFCLPSFAEGVPVVLMEAMSCGLPVVTTYITGIPELVTDGVEGFAVTPGRADRVADALEKLVDPELRARMGACGRQKVEREFSVNAVGPQMRAIFERLPGVTHFEGSSS